MRSPLSPILCAGAICAAILGGLSAPYWVFALLILAFLAELAAVPRTPPQ